jgi:hypothetical protein
MMAGAGIGHAVLSLLFVTALACRACEDRPSASTAISSIH